MPQTTQILKVPYVMLISEYDSHHVMTDYLRPALHLGRAVDMPCALSMDQEQGREGMPCVASQ